MATDVVRASLVDRSCSLFLSEIVGVVCLDYSKTCLKRPLKIDKTKD